MLYRIHFATDASEPIPPVETLPAVEADDPIVAADLLAAEGISPAVTVARVILSVHPNGLPHLVVRVPMGRAARE